MPILFDILLAILFMWAFQLRFSFIIKPRKSNSLTLSIYVFSFLMWKWWSTFVCGLWNVMYLLLPILIDNLLHFNLSFIRSTSRLILYQQNARVSINLIYKIMKQESIQILKFITHITTIHNLVKTVQIWAPILIEPINYRLIISLKVST